MQGVQLKAFFPSFNLGLMRISRSSFKQSKNIIYAHYMNVCFTVFCKFWRDLGDVWEEIVFLKGLVKCREIRNIEDLCDFKIRI